MDNDKGKPTDGDGDGEPAYVDIQAGAGIIEHTGGYEATDWLHSL
jgi:hypothetical protein